MQSFDVKRGHFKDIEGEKLKELVIDVFGSAEEEGDRIRTSYLGLKKLTVWLDGKVLFVDTEMDPRVDEVNARKTIQSYNSFMERATGFNSKERRSRAKKKVVGKD
jgi:hypothetical protein